MGYISYINPDRPIPSIFYRYVVWHREPLPPPKRCNINASHLICYDLNKILIACKIEGMKSLLPSSHICLTLFHHHVKTCQILYEYWSVRLCWWYSRVALDNRRVANRRHITIKIFDKPVCWLIYLSIVANDAWLGSMAWFPATFTMLATYRSLVTCIA